MREFILSNGDRFHMTDNHLLYIGDTDIDYRADVVKIEDKLKLFNGSFVSVIGINENVLKYARNIITYNGNLVINGIAISTFIDTAFTIISKLCHSNECKTVAFSCLCWNILSRYLIVVDVEYHHHP